MDIIRILIRSINILRKILDSYKIPLIYTKYYLIPIGGRGMVLGQKVYVLVLKTKLL